MDGGYHEPASRPAHRGSPRLTAVGLEPGTRPPTTGDELSPVQHPPGSPHPARTAARPANHHPPAGWRPGSPPTLAVSRGEPRRACHRAPRTRRTGASSPGPVDLASRCAAPPSHDSLVASRSPSQWLTASPKRGWPQQDPAGSSRPCDSLRESSPPARAGGAAQRVRVAPPDPHMEKLFSEHLH